MLLGSTCYYNGNHFFVFVYPYPYHNSGLLQVGLISGSILLYMILHDLHSACYCSGGGNHLLGLPLTTAIYTMFVPCICFFSRFSIGGVLCLTCIPSPLAWWHQHDITSIAKWRGQASSWLLVIWHSLIAKSLLAIWRSCTAKALLMISRSCIAKCILAVWGLYIALSLLTIWRSCIAKWGLQFGDILLLSSNNRVSTFFGLRV